MASLPSSRAGIVIRIDITAAFDGKTDPEPTPGQMSSVNGLEENVAAVRREKFFCTLKERFTHICLRSAEKSVGLANCQLLLGVSRALAAEFHEHPLSPDRLDQVSVAKLRSAHRLPCAFLLS